MHADDATRVLSSEASNGRASVARPPGNDVYGLEIGLDPGGEIASGQGRDHQVDFGDRGLLRVDHAVDGVPSVLASLTKGGINAATKSLAIEYAKRGIRVNAVSPGIIKTPMHGEETHAALGSLHPVGHMGEIDDIVQAILYLDGANFVTGEILHVDGGQSAGH